MSVGAERHVHALFGFNTISSNRLKNLRLDNPHDTHCSFAAGAQLKKTITKVQ